MGFTGRTLCGDDKKYINTRKTPVYTKGDQLFGMNFAREGIKYHDSAYLVEGNADVIRMHQIGVPNTVGICSTSFTDIQLEALQIIATNITIIPDSDPAGRLSLDRSAQMIIQAGMSCNVLELPPGAEIRNEAGKVTGYEKTDADSFFTGLVQFTAYSKAHLNDYIINKAFKYSELPATPANRIRAMDEISRLIYRMDPLSHELYIDQVSKLIKPKKAWTDRISQMVKENTLAVVKESKTDTIPEHISLVDWQKYGFYEDKNCYFFRTQKGIERG